MIFLSAGHYPERPGACFGEFCEHGEAVKWVNMIAGIIDTNVVIVPTGNLRKKTGYINDYDAQGVSICAEIHFNSAMKDGEHIGEGAETLYMPDSQRGAYLARAVQDSLTDDNLFRDRGIKEGWYRMNRLNGADFFLSKTVYPAVIIEPEFIHHEERIKKLSDDACTNIAEALIGVHDEFNGSAHT